MTPKPRHGGKIITGKKQIIPVIISISPVIIFPMSVIAFPMSAPASLTAV